MQYAIWLALCFGCGGVVHKPPKHFEILVDLGFALHWAYVLVADFHDMGKGTQSA